MTTPPRPLTSCLAALVAIGTLSASTAATPAASAAPPAPNAAPAAASAGAAARARLEVKPHVHVGGQQLTWVGNIGATGRRTVRLQRNLGRPGDAWKPVDGTASRTASNGSFRFKFRAPTMQGIKFRVAGGGRATPAKTFMPRAQDVTLRATQRAVAGSPFTIAVDTTPDDLARRPDTPSPVFPGRKLTLQKRDVTSQARRGYTSPWSTVATTTSNSQGNGSFRVTVGSPGTAIFRVRMENWTKNGDRVGWFPSFPLPVKVHGSSRAAEVSRSSVRAEPAQVPVSPEPDPAETADRTVVDSSFKQGAGTNAGQKHGWTPALWDFDWPYGESLSSAPFRGSRDQGRWLDTSTGTGRADLHNGALKLDSQRDNKDGRGDRGTTGVTLRGNASTYGRWEMRLRMKSSETNAREYRTLVELVPENASDYACGANTITVARLAAHGKKVSFGARSAARNLKWTGKRANLRFNNLTHHFAVEMGKRHITWFVDGRPVGTLKGRAAVPDVPMTIRFRMVGKRKEMNRTQAIADWVRGFPLDTAKNNTSGKRLRASRYKGGC